MNSTTGILHLAFAGVTALAAAPIGAQETPAAQAATSSAASPSWRPSPLPGTCTRPEYPLASIRRQEKGTSVIDLTVDTNGAVTGSSVRQSSGSRLLDQVATHAMSACRFKPALDSTGTPMTSSYPMRYDWRLEDAPPDPWVSMRTLAGGGFKPTGDVAAIPFEGESAATADQRAKMLQAVRDEATDKALCASVERVAARIAEPARPPEQLSLESWTVEQCGHSMRYVVAVAFPEGKPARFRFLPLAPQEPDPFAKR